MVNCILTLAGTFCFAGESPDCNYVCERIYPVLDEVHSRPEVIYPESVIGRGPLSEDSETGCFFRLLFYSSGKYICVRADRILLPDPDMPFYLVDVSYDIDFPKLLNIDPHSIQFVKWVDLAVVRPTLRREQCYEFRLGCTTAEATAEKCMTPWWSKLT